jgi:AraC-like DNA-binding protein
MHRVVAYIDQHLDQPLDLRALAEVAYFSPFHFHRLFAAWMGETLGDYLRRRRVEVAAMRLAAQPRLTVLNLALSVGFGSAEAFTRAFKNRFGCSPSAWRTQQSTQRRANSNPSQVDSKMRQVPVTISAEHEASHITNWGTIMNVKLIDRQPVTVAYLRHLGAYGEAISQFWQNTYYPWRLRTTCCNKLAMASATTTPASRRQSSAGTMPVWKLHRNSLCQAALSKQPFRVANMLFFTTAVWANGLLMPGLHCCGNGYLPADFNLMPDHASSTTRQMPSAIPRSGRSSVRYASPSFRSDLNAKLPSSFSLKCRAAVRAAFRADVRLPAYCSP